MSIIERFHCRSGVGVVHTSGKGFHSLVYWSWSVVAMLALTLPLYPSLYVSTLTVQDKVT